MSNEGKDNEEITPIEPDGEGSVKLEKDSEGKYPKVVPWSKYVGIKESLGGKLQAAEEKVKSLEEQLKNAPNAEEFGRIKQELGDAKSQLETKTTELTSLQEKTATELKAELKKRGVSDEDVAEMSEAEMRRTIKVLGSKKPSPDLGGGGGSGELKGSPMELARQGYAESGKSK
jgi:hypothetical protein